MAMAAQLSARGLYRVQLATARLFDREPGLKSLLSLLLRGSAADAAQEPALALARRYQAAFLRGLPADAAALGAAAAAPAADATATPPLYTPAKSLADFVRAAYRAPGEGGQRLSAATLCQAELVRAADLSQVFASTPDGQAGDTPSLRDEVEGLCEGQLAEADAIRPGTLLLEHPAALTPGRGCLLVYDIAQNVAGVHGDEDWVLRAYALNRPFPASVADVTRMGGLGQLGQLTLFHGGADGNDALSVVHRFADLPGAVPVDGPPEEEGAGGSGGSDGDDLPSSRSGLFVGGNVDAINEALASGRAAAHDFRVAMGHVEIRLRKAADGGLELPDAERWLVAAGPGVSSIALCPPLFDTQGLYRDGRGLALGSQGQAQGQGPPVVGYNFARFWHQNAVWAGALRKLAAWVEMADAARGRELAGFAAVTSHAAVAHYVAAGLAAEDVLDIVRQNSNANAGANGTAAAGGAAAGADG